MMGLDFSRSGRKSLCPLWGEGGHVPVSAEKGREVAAMATDFTVHPPGSLLLV